MTRTTCRRLFAPALLAGLCLAPFAEVGDGALVHVASPTPSDPDEGGTALHWAARLGAMDVGEALVAAGVDPDARDADGETALHWLARRNEGGPWLAGADRAALLGRIDAADAVAPLVELGADVQAATGFGRTALHEAARTDASGMVSALLDAGARVDATVDGVTALYAALRAARSPHTVSALVAAGADVRRRMTGWDETPLHQAAYNFGAEIAGVLLEAGADVNARDNEGETPMHWLVRGMTDPRTEEVDLLEALQTMQVLAAHDADTVATNDAGDTPMALGRRLNQERARRPTATYRR